MLRTEFVAHDKYRELFDVLKLVRVGLRVLKDAADIRVAVLKEAHLPTFLSRENLRMV